MKYDKLIERLQKLIGFTPKQAELCKILDYTSSKISARAQRNSDFSDEEIAASKGKEVGIVDISV